MPVQPTQMKLTMYCQISGVKKRLIPSSGRTKPAQKNDKQSEHDQEIARLFPNF